MNTMTHCPHCGQPLYDDPKPQEKAEDRPAYADMPIEAQIMAGVPKIYIPKSDTIKNALREHFRLTPNWKPKFNREWMEWAVGADMEEDSIESAANIWKMDKRYNWQIPNLKGIQEHWEELASPQALFWGLWMEHLLKHGRSNPYRTMDEFFVDFVREVISVYEKSRSEELNLERLHMLSIAELLDFLGMGMVELYKDTFLRVSQE